MMKFRGPGHDEANAPRRRRRGSPGVVVGRRRMHRRIRPARRPPRPPRRLAGRPRPRPPFPVAENKRSGTSAWRITDLGPGGAIDGYADQQSVLPGQSFRLYVSTTARSFRVDAFRFGWYSGHQARLVWTSTTSAGSGRRRRRIASGTHMVTAPWRPSLTISTANWAPGSYLLRLDAVGGAERYVPITVRSASTAGAVVILNDNTTWQAYNAWGGYSLYQGPDGLPTDRGYAVSFDRPYDEDGAVRFLALRPGGHRPGGENRGPARLRNRRRHRPAPGHPGRGPRGHHPRPRRVLLPAMRHALAKPGTSGPTWPSSARTPSTGTSGSRPGTASSSATRPPPSTRCTARTTPRPPSSGGTRPTRGRRASSPGSSTSATRSAPPGSSTTRPAGSSPAPAPTTASASPAWSGPSTTGSIRPSRSPGRCRCLRIPR